MARLVPGLIPVLLLTLLAAGCASNGVSVRTTYDHEVAFDRFATFAWAEVPPQARTAIADLSLLDLLEQQLEASGLRHVEQDPDVLVAVHRSIEGTINTEGWGYEVDRGRLRYYELQQGTLVVDVIDADTRRNVWRGTAQGVFRFDQDPQLRTRMLRELLAEMFAEYPPRSGS